MEGSTYELLVPEAASDCVTFRTDRFLCCSGHMTSCLVISSLEVVVAFTLHD